MNLGATENGTAIGFGFIAAFVFLAGYFNHDSGSCPFDSPDRLRRLLRRGFGRLRVTAVAAELAGVTLLLLDALHIGGVVSVGQMMGAYTAALGGLLLILVVCDFVDRRRRK